MKDGALSQASKRVASRSVKPAGKQKSVAGLNSWIILTISILDKMVTK